MGSEISQILETNLAIMCEGFGAVIRAKGSVGCRKLTGGCHHSVRFLRSTSFVELGRVDGKDLRVQYCEVPDERHMKGMTVYRRWLGGDDVA